MEDFTIGIFEPDGFPLSAFQHLEWLGPVVTYKDGADEAAFLGQVDALFVRLGRHLRAELLDQAPRLKYLCSPTTGLTHLELGALEQRNIQLLSLKGETEFLQGIRATPEHALGLTLGLLRNYHRAFCTLDNSSWNRNLYIGHEIYGKTVGIVGLGRVGLILAGYFHALGCRVVGINRSPVEGLPSYMEMVGNLPELAQLADVVIIAASYEQANDKMLTRALLESLRGKYLINIARGELVDEEALIDLIAQGHFAGVALDVIRDETKGLPHLPQLLELAEEHNLLITPHIAGATVESMFKAETFLAEKLITQLRKRGMHREEA
jgi:phosphoglycerate dehydrogenase-like enzyme